jgi:hypothetical protein
LRIDGAEFVNSEGLRVARRQPILLTVFGQ